MSVLLLTIEISQSQSEKLICYCKKKGLRWARLGVVLKALHIPLHRRRIPENSHRALFPEVVIKPFVSLLSANCRVAVWIPSSLRTNICCFWLVQNINIRPFIDSYSHYAYITDMRDNNNNYYYYYNAYYIFVFELHLPRLPQISSNCYETWWKFQIKCCLGKMVCF